MRLNNAGRVVRSSIAALTVITLSSTAIGDDKTKLQIAGTISDIVRAKTYTESYVRMAKKSLASSPSDLAEAQGLYAAVYSNSSAWVAYVHSALLAEGGKGLGQDEKYDSLSKAASGSGTRFTAFVDTKVSGESKAITAVLASLGALGLQLWTGVKAQTRADRVLSASDFIQQTQWAPWEAINEDGTITPQRTAPISSDATGAKGTTPGDSGNVSPQTSPTTKTAPKKPKPPPN